MDLLDGEPNKPKYSLYILTFRVVIIFGSPLWRSMNLHNGDPNIHPYCNDSLCLDLQLWDPWISMKENYICSSINSKYLDLHLEEPNFMIQHVLPSLSIILDLHFGEPFWISNVLDLQILYTFLIWISLKIAFPFHRSFKL